MKTVNQSEIHSEAMTSPRASVACDHCRGSKLKCLNFDTSKCQRCHQLALDCTYTLKKSQLKRKNLSHRYLSKSFNDKLMILKPRHFKDLSKESPIQTPIEMDKLKDPNMNRLDRVILPPKSLILEVVEIFFENQYKSIFPFLHKPSFLSFIRSPEFDPGAYLDLYESKFFQANYCQSFKYPDPVVLISILALTSRLHPIMSKIYGGFSEIDSPSSFIPKYWNSQSHKFNLSYLDSTLIEEDSIKASQASNYFGWHARNLLKNVFDSPTIQRIQALVLLSSHEWGEGNNSRSYLYVGIAARMALVLGLGEEKNLKLDEGSVEEYDDFMKFIATESKRRTIWSVYMMDRCNSSGRNRSSCVKLDDIKIKLPCQEKDFTFGNEINESLTFKQANDCVLDPLKKSSLSNLSTFAFQILLFENWASIAKWVGETSRKSDQTPPYESGSTFHKLSTELDLFKSKLPNHLVYNKFNLEAHIADGSGTSFGYFHCLLFLCRIFLNREYVFCNPDALPLGWWKSTTFDLLKSLKEKFELINTLHGINRMVLAPFTGFEVFTLSATCFYFNTFPSEVLLKHLPLTDRYDDLVKVEDIKNTFQQIGAQSLELLKTWKNAWGLGRGWYYTAIKLQSLFESVNTKDTDNLQNENIRNTLHDYGNGEVDEVYKPEYIRKKEMNILNLLVNENSDDSTSDHIENNYYVSSTSKLDPKNAVSAFINSPGLDFMNNFDLSSMFPGWTDAMKI